jgi:hypothetical protein
MGVSKRILCLANSRKPSGRCIAGIEIAHDGQPLGWIRPISSHGQDAVHDYERQYPDGSEPRLLDIINMPLLKPAPDGCQSENWLLDTSGRWQRTGLADMNLLSRCICKQKAIWANGHSTTRGENDEIPSEEADALTNSLMLIQVPWLGVTVYEGPKGLCARGWFPYGESMYGLRITDPVFEQMVFNHGLRNRKFGNAYVTVSLTMPMRKDYGSGQQYRYKVIAAIIANDGVAA